MANEMKYRKELIQKLNEMFPGCYILKNDPSELQGVPDILILFRDSWAMLEVKFSHNSPKQPNQEYYIERFGEMSFASFINPENEDEVLCAIQQSFRFGRKARIS